MGKLDNESGLDRRPAGMERPAVAVEANGQSDAVAGTILRAQREGYRVFLLAEESLHSESKAFAEQLGAFVVSTDSTHDNENQLDALKRVAREKGFPGIIYHESPEESIDFERTSDRLTEVDAYVVGSETALTVDSSSTVLVAVPAYNEAETIEAVVTTACEYADEVLVVDDGSDDATAKLAREKGATVIEHDHNKGYGGALKTAFQEANRCNVTHLAIIDGDGQHDPAEIKKLVAHQKETEAELVVGCRFDDKNTKIPVFRRAGLSVVNILTNISLGIFRPSSWVSDTQNGFRVYDERAIKSLAEDSTIGDHMGASTDILHHAHKEGYDIEEIGASVDYDVANGNSIPPIQHGWTLVSNLLRTVEQERPLLAFGFPGLILSLIGVGFSYWTFTNYISTSTFPIGLGISSVFFVFSGILMLFSSIILHTLKQYLSNFERNV